MKVTKDDDFSEKFNEMTNSQKKEEVIMAKFEGKSDTADISIKNGVERYHF